MGLDEFLTETTPTDSPVPVPTPSSLKLVKDSPADSPLTNFVTGTDETSRLKLSVAEGNKLDTARSTRVLKMQGQTGLPPDFIEPNLDYVEAKAAEAGFNADEFRK